jgi:hypothetical protein
MTVWNDGTYFFFNNIAAVWKVNKLCQSVMNYLIPISIYIHLSSRQACILRDWHLILRYLSLISKLKVKRQTCAQFSGSQPQLRRTSLGILREVVEQMNKGFKMSLQTQNIHRDDTGSFVRQWTVLEYFPSASNCIFCSLFFNRLVF